MPEYVYGIVEGGAEAPQRRGIKDAPVRLVAGDGAAALVSDLPEGDLELGRDELLVHARVLEEMLSSGTVLPMSFGVVLEGPDEVRSRLLERHAGELQAQLEHFGGKVEVNIRAVYDQEVLMREVVRGDREIQRLREQLRGKPDDATYYERIRLGELVAQAIARQREVDSRQIVDAMGPSALEIQVGEPAHERIAFSASFLVARDQLDEFDKALDRLAESQSGRLRFKYTGPLPPHSFVEFTQGG